MTEVNKTEKTTENKDNTQQQTQFFVNAHSSIRLDGQGKTVYIDPFLIENTPKDADIVFITHPHTDHFSKEDIVKVAKEGQTVFVCTVDVFSLLVACGIAKQNIVVTSVGGGGSVQGVLFSAFASFNENKQYHPKQKGWVGYTVTLNGKKYTYLGDTDANEELGSLSTDVLFVPIGGEYTMDAYSAAQLAIKIAPSLVVPVHYGSVVGTEDDLNNFLKLVEGKVNSFVAIVQNKETK